VVVSDILRERSGGVEIDIIVSPRADTSAVRGIDPWRNRLVVKVSSPPEGGKANKELCNVLSDFFKADVEVVKGHTSRLKTVFVRLDKASVAFRLKGST
jgi:uncharacterized protein (TIGR00251 family)